MTTTVTTASSGPLIASGTTPIPFTFQAVSADEVEVTLNGGVVDRQTYTVSLNDDGTGSVASRQEVAERRADRERGLAEEQGQGKQGGDRAGEGGQKRAATHRAIEARARASRSTASTVAGPPQIQSAEGISTRRRSKAARSAGCQSMLSASEGAPGGADTSREGGWETSSSSEARA